MNVEILKVWAEGVRDTGMLADGPYLASEAIDVANTVLVLMQRAEAAEAKLARMEQERDTFREEGTAMRAAYARARDDYEAAEACGKALREALEFFWDAVAAEDSERAQTGCDCASDACHHQVTVAFDHARAALAAEKETE